ncbi:hypothetical protein [Chitiniphilus eburneus]|uniref:Uncharacterized protein n=1 Tax=Chitiniphilus eburneus TaxID=2571148 RepID=A0A4U0PHH5_9NEIS|nr:hypothetical protein [Chitiniphilus eburneus]TJZ67431.1 hypothetical protein FAZ21_16300 [Chitiniphilus eburneus]
MNVIDYIVYAFLRLIKKNVVCCNALQMMRCGKESATKTISPWPPRAGMHAAPCREQPATRTVSGGAVLPPEIHPAAAIFFQPRLAAVTYRPAATPPTGADDRVISVFGHRMGGLPIRQSVRHCTAWRIRAIAGNQIHRCSYSIPSAGQYGQLLQFEQHE